jgi:hypothetical protein
VLYLGNPCGPLVVKAMRDGVIGLIDTPLQGSAEAKREAHEAGAAWCADNGAFSDKFDEATWWQFLQDNAHRASTCLFAVAPDVVGDAEATHERSAPWLAKIRELGYPVAYVAQDGLEDLELPHDGTDWWDSFDVLFIGGSTAWKLGPHVRRIAAQAKARGKHVHMGRVNSEKRFRYAHAIGCDSVDGTFLTFGPDTNLPRLMTWLRSLDQGALFEAKWRGEVS